VRGLENNLKKILRKVALKKAREQGKRKKSNKEIIDKSNLKDFIGKPIFTSDVYYEKTPTGVATGLAWTSLGGVTLYIETRKAYSEKTLMKLTGQAGDVMKESSQIAWSYLASMADKYAPQKDFFEKTVVHMHIPEGATPKDGPSAGITMVTALLSLLLDKPIKESLAMTGEITLTGVVLPIGGLKEKLIAARRSKIKNLIFPKGNVRDYDELPAFLKEGLNINFVDHYEEVYKIAFGKKDDKFRKRASKKMDRAASSRKKGAKSKRKK
nr:Lon protease [Candidatus Anoxychlamydiales bacterium]